MTVQTSEAGAKAIGESPISLSDKVRFLSGSSVHGLGAEQVEVIETRMSFVFLAGERAYKLKKPVELPFQDFTTLAARKANCLAEATLNRRLAPNVYLGVTPLTLTPSGGLRLGGEGEAVEWLVVMRRLPEELMLDQLLASGPLDEEKAERLASRLAQFFRSAARGKITGADYFARMRNEQAENRALLTRRPFAVDHGRVPIVLDRMDAALTAARPLLESRAEMRRLVDGHGDLRPEHICFADGIEIFDCLEFNADLRLTDPVEEIASLGLECELLGAPALGPDIFARIMAAMGEDPPLRLFHLHFARKGLLRMRQSLAHLLEPKPRSPERWEPLARRYIALAERGVDRFEAARVNGRVTPPSPGTG